MTFIPSDSHSGFYFPPSASKDRAGMDGCFRIQKMPSGLYKVVRPGDIFRFGRSQSPGPSEFRGKFSFWQETDIIQVLRCTLYAEALKLYRVTLSRTENRPKL